MNPRPSTDATIFLNLLIIWQFQGADDPLILDYGTIWPASAGSEVACGFHLTFLAR
ncbi:hypothetical protein ACFL1V_06940 [Pseudomonadota bacterium]